MCLDYSEKGKLTISIKEYRDNIINEFLEVIERTALTPAAYYLFQIRDEIEASKLDEESAISFHYAVAQLLFLNV